MLSNDWLARCSGTSGVNGHGFGDIGQGQAHGTIHAVLQLGILHGDGNAP